VENGLAILAIYLQNPCVNW